MYSIALETCLCLVLPLLATESDSNLEGGLLSHSICLLGDVDRDGISDFAVGDPRPNRGRQLLPGRVWIVSGASPQSIYCLEGQKAGDWFGATLQLIDDITGDGVGELLIGAPQIDTSRIPGDIVAVSVPNAEAIFRSKVIKDRRQWEKGGIASSVVEDIDSDGVREIAVFRLESPGKDGDVVFLSGRNGKVVHELSQVSDIYCQLIGPTGQLDFAPGSIITLREGEIRLLAISNGDELLSLSPSAKEFDSFGKAACGGFDVDADGVADFAVTSSTVFPKRSVVLYSGANGREVHRFESDGKFGEVLLMVQDRDGDEIMDLLISTPGSFSQETQIALYSTRSGESIRKRLFEPGDTKRGRSIAEIGDLNDDGVPELAVGRYFGVGHPQGRVLILSGVDLKDFSRWPLEDHLESSQYKFISLADERVFVKK